jgi:polysaccharide export outer membrane protein
VKLSTVILAGFLILPALGRAQEGTPPPSNDHAGLIPGDQLNIRMYDFPDVGAAPVSVRVGDDGTIHLPYAGTLQVRGMLPEDVQEAISKSLKDKGIVKSPNVTVDLTYGSNLTVSVLGQVLQPKVIQLYGTTTLANIMSQVGGITGLAERQLTILHRGNDMPTSVPYDPDAPTPQALNTIIRPGDVITVSNRGVYFVGGEVNRPGIYPLGGLLSAGLVTSAAGEGILKNITLLEALSQAGGITPIASRAKMHILRVEDGKRVDIIVDQVKLSKGEVADPILHANDIIYLQPSYWRLQTNNIFSTALASVTAAASIRTANF